MKVSYTWLQTYFDQKLPEPEKLGALFNAHAFELEGLEKVQTAAGSDSVFDLKVLPDRAHYALCHRGMAREASGIAKMPLKGIVSPKIAPEGTVSKVAVNLGDTKLCRRYAARKVEGVKATASPAWLRDRLESIGARSINTLVDATNYVMFDIGQPLHAFDADKVKGGIWVRPAREGEKMTLLDGREIVLSASDLVIADSEGPLALAGVKGGKRAEVTASTKNIILESANFNPTAVRRTSTRLNLRNDSSKRFESDITSDLAGDALDRVTALILELCQGAKAGAVTDVYEHPAEPWRVSISVSHISSMIGTPVSLAEAKDILERQGCAVSVSADGKDIITITPPLDRLDLVIPEDISDEIARIKGYENLLAQDTPQLAESVAIDPVFYWSERVKNVLVSLGFSEVQTYSLVPKGAFEIAYPLASDKAALRERLAPKIVQSLSMNTLNADVLGLDAVKIFEIGKVFPKSGEMTALSFGVSLPKKKKGVSAESVVKESLIAIMAALGMKEDAIQVPKIEIGPHGAVVEINFDTLIQNLATSTLQSLNFSSLPKDKKYMPFSLYPYITRDIALFVPTGTADVTVAECIRTAAVKAAGDLLVKGPDLFDHFEKDGKISYAFRMIFQSFKKTLSDDEVNSFMTTVYAVVKGNGWEVR